MELLSRGKITARLNLIMMKSCAQIGPGCEEGPEEPETLEQLYSPSLCGAYA